jgi:hypothetical protein
MASVEGAVAPWSHHLVAYLGQSRALSVDIETGIRLRQIASTTDVVAVLA